MHRQLRERNHLRRQSRDRPAVHLHLRPLRHRLRQVHLRPAPPQHGVSVGNPHPPMSLRNRLLRLAFALVMAAGALLATLRPPADAYAALAGCSVRCPDGSSCSGSPAAGETCSCSCSFWGENTSVCTCQSLKPSTPG